MLTKKKSLPKNDCRYIPFTEVAMTSVLPERQLAGKEQSSKSQVASD